MNFKTIILIASIYVICLSSAGLGKDKAIEQVFVKYKINGTMVIQSLDGKVQFIHNNKRAKEQLMPGETFEIPLTLIALSTGAIENKEDVIRWDGRDKGSPKWNRDQTLESAFATSCQWYFQNVALSVGERRLGSYLRKIDYGNKSLKYDVTMCWFDGRLEISALGQIEFLEKYYKNKLPHSKSEMELVTEMIPVIKTSSYTLRGRKGIVKSILPNIGWYIGFVETTGKVYFFAVNMDLPDVKGEKYPWTITKLSLQAKKIL
jgi:beta-lactamase class D